MLDPLSALGLAAGIVQFVDFAGKVVSRASRFTRDQSDLTADTLRNITTDLTAISTSIREQRPYKSLNDPLALPAEKALDELCVNCKKLGDELVACLTKICEQSKGKTWFTVRAALKSVWHEDKIEQIAVLLDSYRQELILRILTILNAQHAIQALGIDRRFDGVERSNKEIVEVLAISNSKILSNLNQGAVDHATYQTRASAEAERRHAETIAAIVTLRDGTTEALLPRAKYSSSTIPRDNVSSQTALTIRARSERNDATQDEGSSDATASLDSFGTISQKVLGCLYFRQIADRFDDVASAHHKTFAWIFDRGNTHRGWDDFIGWLANGRGCYWINGKAGSGKSTLMKYIWNDHRFKDALTKWAGAQELILVSFFFWNLGSPLQKTQSGLLRSLLFDILQDRQHLIPLVFPGLYQAAKVAVAKDTVGAQAISHDLIEPTFIELKKAFKILMQQKLSGLRICLLIDGVDEYDGDHSELSELFMSMGESPFIKVVLSSRPIPACVDIFSPCPTLRLQDLTYDDIKEYVNEQLGNSPRMVQLEKRHTTEARQLVEDIINKASGVFLWVILSVKSLLSGLQNYDSMTDLRRRLDVLPPDLENLYHHMLKLMTPFYRQQASIILQIVLHSLQIQSERPLTSLQMYHAMVDDPTVVVQMPMNQLSSTDKAEREDLVEGRIRSRCCGLVEVYKRQLREPQRDVGSDRVVGFLHRTVAEFLRQDHVQTYISSFVTDPGFDSNLSLSISSLAILKMLQPYTEAFQPQGIIVDYARFSVAHLNASSELAFRVAWDIGRECGRCMKEHWSSPYRPRIKSSATRFWPLAILNASSPFPASCFIDIANEDDVGALLLFLCSSLPATGKKYIFQSIALSREAATCLLAQLLFERFYWASIGMSSEEPVYQTTIENIERLSDAIIVIVHGRASPNELLSFWDNFETQNRWHSHIKLLKGKELLQLNELHRKQGWGCTPWEFFLAYTNKLRPAQMTAPGSRRLQQDFVSSYFQSTLKIYEQFLNSGAAAGAAIPCASSAQFTRPRRTTLRKNAAEILQEFQIEMDQYIGAGSKSIAEASYAHLAKRLSSLVLK